MDFNSFKVAAVAAAEAAGIADYELYFQSADSLQVSAFAHEVEHFSSSVEGGVCLRCLVNGRMGYASTQDLSAESAADLVRRAADNAAVLETEEPEFFVDGGQSYRETASADRPMPGAQQLIDAVLAGQDALYAAGAVDGSEGQVFAERSTIAITNSHGLDVAYTATLAGYAAEAVVTDGKEKTNDYNFRMAPVEELDVAAIAGKAVADARAALGAGVAATGTSPVVFAPKAMSQLLATYAGVFSAENALKGLSLLAGKEGETVAAPCVTLVDDPFYCENPMHIPFDAEGTPARCKNVIEGGCLKTLLYNLRTAAAAGRETTGNAAKSGYDSKVTVRPSTMVLAAGSLTEEELLAKAEGGVYITSLGGLHAGANPISGDFSLQSSGFLIEGGRLGAPVRSFTVAGNFLTLLKGITALSDKVEMSPGAGSGCFAAPTVLTEGLSIAGK